ncbi:MAG: nitroreductase [Spirochaetia bacterium]|nr:nitroreductase [Spirochaetia bacterium]
MAETKECIETRVSVRSFKSDDVSDDIIISAIKTAQRTPSYKNSQPWQVAIVKGDKLKELSALYIHLLEENIPLNPDIPKPVSWPDEINIRMNETQNDKSKEFNINLSNPEIALKSKKANYRFFGAPCVIYLYQDKMLNEWSIFDMGAFAQTLMLALWNKKIGSVPQAYLTDYSTQIKEFLGISQNKRLCLGISLGYPNYESIMAVFRTKRENVDSIIKWIR